MRSRIILVGLVVAVYNIGTMEEVTVQDVAYRTAKCLNTSIRIIPGNPVPGEALRRCPDIRKLQALGYSPCVSFEDGLLPTVNWYLENEKLWPRLTSLEKQLLLVLKTIKAA